jgi:hypothetical protein
MLLLCPHSRCGWDGVSPLVYSHADLQLHMGVHENLRQQLHLILYLLGGGLQLLASSTADG